MRMNTLKTSKWLIWTVVSLLATLVLVGYWRYSVNHPATDDAYVEANIIQISSQVTGQVASVTVADNQTVKKGTVLFTIDRKPYEIAVKLAKAQLQIAKQNMAAFKDAVQVAQASVNQRAAELTDIQRNYTRSITLVKNGTYPKSNGDDVTAKLKVAEAGYLAALNQFKQAEHQLGDVGQDNAAVQAAEANLDKALYDLNHTTITAPADGTVTNLTLRVGNIAAAGQALFAFVETDQIWVAANFKETQLQHMLPGQSASIKIDMYPNQSLEGTVESISHGSGSAFSIMPPENASGNWIKVTQRFPVRIKLKNPQNEKQPLRVGSSSHVTVDTSGS